MKNSFRATFFFVAALAACYSFAQGTPIGQWRPLANTLYVLSPMESSKTYLGASIDDRTRDMAINIFDFSNQVCKSGEDMPVQDGSPISINRKFVKFKTTCINGTHILQPASETGKKFLNMAVISGHPVTVDAGDGVTLHYPGSTIAPIRTKLLSARNAM
ncbi:hypothetical protein [Burkholderia aenigmatica]|uniref:hypothetical protein n=1 Tax=Burkholderia aenigmatica TaxID=2015348 RepID=UPI0015833900|nr:hypothetical protein [Burkholderia aenigmatica]